MMFLNLFYSEMHLFIIIRKDRGRGESSQNLSNSMDPYGVIQENIRCVARAHMVCCKSTYVVLQEHICCVARAHIALSEPEQASQWAR